MEIESLSVDVLLRFESCNVIIFVMFFFFQAEDGIRDLVRSRGLGDVYKRQELEINVPDSGHSVWELAVLKEIEKVQGHLDTTYDCLLYTSDAADERSSVDLGGRRIIKKKKQKKIIRTYIQHKYVEKTLILSQH